MVAATLLVKEKITYRPHNIFHYRRIAQVSTNRMMYDEVEFEVILVDI